MISLRSKLQNDSLVTGIILKAKEIFHAATIIMSRGTNITAR
jgi:hypothetical protein